MAVPTPKIQPKPYPFIDPSQFRDYYSGKTVLVTGSARGIGQQIARHFALAGAASIAVVDLQLSTLSQTVDLCQEAGAKAFPFSCDVSKEDEVKTMLEDAVKHLGGHIDVLVNCAGISNDMPIFLESVEHVWRMVEVNLKGPLNTMMGVLPLMRERGQGCIINIASRSGTVVVPYSTGYSVSKAGLIKATECIQKDIDTDGLGDKIQIYALHPGGVQTELAKRATPEIVAKHYPYLAENRPKWVANFNTSVELCGAVCAFIGTGQLKDSMRGRYIDVEHDMETLVNPIVKEDIVKNDRYKLRVTFPGHLTNAGGSSPEVFKFEDGRV